MANVKLGDVLPDEALNELSQWVKDGTVTEGKLKSLCAKHKEHLLTKGVDDKYLAYVLIYQLNPETEA